MNPEAGKAPPLALATGLAQKAKGGDPAAFDKLVDLFWGDIYRMAYYRTHSAMDAEDIAQDTFIKAYDALDKLKDAEHFRPWLYSIAVNLVKDHYRRRGPRWLLRPLEETDEQEPAAPGQPGGGRVLEDLADKELWGLVREFCQGLPTGEREAFTLHFIDGLSIKEVAHALGKGESAVKTQLYRAVAKFRTKRELVLALRGEA